VCEEEKLIDRPAKKKDMFNLPAPFSFDEIDLITATPHHTIWKCMYK
jgi:hypothetical protein